jgi:hypothetical protein
MLAQYSLVNDEAILDTTLGARCEVRAETKRKISDAETVVTALPLETDSVQMAIPYQAWAHALEQPAYKESTIVSYLFVESGTTAS